MVSGSMLAQKAKQFDDGPVRRRRARRKAGGGAVRRKSAMLRDPRRAGRPGRRGPCGRDLPRRLPARPGARRRAGVAAGPVAEVERAFLADPIRSKAMGFYTWSPALVDIFRQDRMLQTELKDAEGIERLARALIAEPKALATYDAYLTLVDRLTNPGAGWPTSARRCAPSNRARPAPSPGAAWPSSPASRSHESDLVLKLYGGRPIPEGFSLVDEMIRRIRSGDLDLKPTDRSGWYDYQTWALEPLVVPEKMPEAARLKLAESYRKGLLDLFRGGPRPDPRDARQAVVPARAGARWRWGGRA